MNEEPKLVEDLSWATPPSGDAGWTSLWIWAGVIALMVIVAAIVWVRYRRGKGLPFVSAPLPHVEALRALDDLEIALGESDDRTFTQAVSDIVRTYIQDRFAIRAPHRSTEEFLFEASTSGHLSDTHQALLADFLVQCDQVKFARQSIVIDRMRELLESARAFVNGTTAELPAGAAPAKAVA